MDLNPFRLDIDELINDFAKGEMTSFTDMKTLWLSKKFSCVFEAMPNTKLGFVMQSLYAHCLGYMTSTDSISHRLGGLYCLYCLHETQPFNPPFRIYLSPWQLKRLKELVIDAKKENVGVVSVLVNAMLDQNLFLFGAVDLKEGSAEERVNELIDVQNARVQHANKRLFADTEIERYIHMDMGKEVDLESLKKMAIDYAMAKELAIKGAEKVIDTQDINHIAENQTLIGDVVGKTIADWNIHKETFYQKTGLNKRQVLENRSQISKENVDAVDLNEKSEEHDDAYVENDDHFSDELEHLLSL